MPGAYRGCPTGDRDGRAPRPRSERARARRRGDRDPDGALPVGPPDLDAELLEDGEHVRVGVPVTVVGAGADDGGPRAGGPEEGGVGRGCTVVRDGQHVDDERVGSGEQVGLGSAFRIARQQDAAAAAGGADHDRGVVELAPREAVGASRRWTKHLEPERPEGDRVADGDVADRDAASGGDREELVGFGQVGRDGPVPHGADGEAPQHLRCATDVVEVPVRHHQEVEPPSPVLPQPPGRGGVLARIDEHPRPGRLEEEGVALADVDRGEREPDGGQTPGQLGHPARRDQDDDGEHGPPRDPGAWPRQQPHADPDERRHRQRACEVGSGVEVLEAVRRREHYVGRWAGQREDRAAGGWVEQPDGAADEREDGGDRGGGDGDQVGRYRGDGDLAERGEDDGDHGDLRADRDGGELGDATRQPPRQVGPDPRSDDEDPRGGGRRQQ
jgi:hypothetical protein